MIQAAPSLRAVLATRLVAVLLALPPLAAFAALLLSALGWSGGGRVGLEPWLYLDRLSLAALLVVGLIGLVVYRFSLSYLRGEPRQGRFLRWLTLTVLAVELMVVSGSLWTFALLWIVVSLSLHRLLVHYPERPRAVIAARQKFLISRLGDLSLLAACGVLQWRFGTLQLPELFERAAEAAALGAEPALGMAGLGFALAAICKSAQVPFHGWLPDTLDTPTPVSALMHAGIVNAGGYLLMRVSPLLVHAEVALGLLVGAGTITAVVGMLVTWTQTEVKRALAWSTVGQMGFMVLQCGLGAFGAAFLHMAGHGVYKAQAFLRSGTLAGAAEPVEPAARPGQALAGLVLGFVLAAPVLALLFQLLGHDVRGMAGGPVLLLLVALALAQLMVPSGGRRRGSGWLRALVLIGYAALAAALITAVETWLAPSLGVVSPLAERGPAGQVLAIVVPAVFAAVALIGVSLPWISKRALGQRLYVQSRNGFYVGARMDRLVRRIWPPAGNGPAVPDRERMHW